MAKLIYAAIASLDGYVEDEEGRSDWAMPDEEVHAFVNDLERPIGTYLYGRRMYETMVFWETASTEADEPAVFWDYAEIWRAAEKIVYSRTLETASSARTRIEREFDRDAVRRLKQSSGADVSADGLGHPQAIECQQADQGVISGGAEPGGDEHDADLVAVQPGGVGLVVEAGSADMDGRGGGDEAFFFGVAVASGNRAQPASHRGASPPQGLEVPAEAFDVLPAGSEQRQGAFGAPGDVLAGDPKQQANDGTRRERATLQGNPGRPIASRATHGVAPADDTHVLRRS